MKYIKIKTKLLPKGTLGMALYPFMLENADHELDEYSINHEKIHFKQQIELLIIPFYLLYGGMYFYNRWVKKQSPREAYRNIPFENEAYSNENDLTYLKNRTLFNWRKY
jgi:hypothetical protein